MFKKKKEAVSKEEIKNDTKLQKRTSRSKDDVKKLFKENYIKKNKLDPEDDNVQALVDDLADREIANSKRMSKVLKQKIGYRELAEKNAEKTKKKEGKKIEKEEEEEEETSFDKFRTIERNKALGSVITKIIKKHPDEGLSFDAVYAKIREVYVDKETDTSREDFKERVNAAFRTAYPDLYKEEIKREERKKLAEDEGEETSPKNYKEKKEDIHKRTRPVKKITDWYKK